MSNINQDSILLAKDLRFGDDDERSGPAQPVSQAEIADLLYNDVIPASERLTRLRQLRGQMTTMEAADRGDDDPEDVGTELDRATEELEALSGESMDPTSVDHNPEDHRETLSPDDDLLLDEEEEEDDDDLFDGGGDGPAEADAGEDDDESPVLDPEEWRERDGFDPDKGVH